MVKFLEICNTVDQNNLAFVVVLIGSCLLNLLLSLSIVFFLFCTGRGNKRKASRSSEVAEQSSTKAEPSDVKSFLQFQPVQVTSSGGFDDGSEIKDELKKMARDIADLGSKMENKRLNEITASNLARKLSLSHDHMAGYLLHNSHDVIGNGVPTAGQVTLEQISAHQAHVRLRVDEIDRKIGKLEFLLSKITS